MHKSIADPLAEKLFNAQQQSIYKHTDRLFAVLMGVQWIGAIVSSLYFTPKTWRGEYFTISTNVYAAIILGGMISTFPIFLALRRPGEKFTRFVIAISQMMMSSLLIHVTGGRIETHFHIFGSLAFLSFYRDWKVLVPATLIVAADHILRGIFWPESVYGVLTEQAWRWVEHAWWVLFEDIFLYILIKRSISEMWDIARRTSEIHRLNDDLEQRIEHRTSELAERNSELKSEVAERKSAQDALAKSEERYRLLFDTNPFPMWVFDRESLGFLAVNDAAIEHYGYSREEFLSMDLTEIRPEEEIPALLDDLSHLAGNKTTVWVHRKKDGTLIDVEITPHHLEIDGKPAEIILANDVTERLRLQAESDVISEVIQGVAETSNLNELLKLIHQSVGRMLYAENFYVALFDPKTEMLNMQFFVDKRDPSPPPSKLGTGLTAYVFRNNQAMLLTEERIGELADAGEVKLVGTTPPIWLGVPLRTPQGVIGVLVVQHYGNAEVYDERDVRFLTSVGDQIALAIDRKRAEEQLRIFNEKLQQSNRELQDFAYVASHDLQEPLRKVQTFSDRLGSKYAERLDETGLDYLERMRNAASRMQTLIQDLLAFSRVTTKAQPFVQVDLEQITRDVLSDLEVKIEETGAAIETRDLPKLDADPLQMRQLIQNLIGNALKFRNADATPIVKISATNGLSNGHGPMYTITVEDNGIGFDEKYLDKIFTVFQRLHGRAEYEGSGIGLAVCRKIVERHHGSITAQSTPGQGAKFIVSLPGSHANTVEVS